MIDEILVDDDVHHAQGERRVGARADRNMPVGLTRGARPDRVDHHQLRAVLPRFGDERPVMQVGADGVAGPEDNVFGVFETFRVHARGRADRHEIRRARGGIAECPLADRGAEPVEEGVPGIQAVQDSLGAEVAVRQDRGRPRFLDDGRPSLLYRGQRLVPGDPFEPAAALGPRPPHRIQQPIGAVDTLFVVVDLHAQAAAGEGMIRIAAHGQRPPVADRYQHGAGIRAIMRAGNADKAGSAGVCGHGNSSRWTMRILQYFGR
jgi:hypothetical protein